MIYGYFGDSLIDQMLDTWTAALDDYRARVASSSSGAAEDKYGTIAASSLADFDDIFSQMERLLRSLSLWHKRGSRVLEVAAPKLLEVAPVHSTSSVGSSSQQAG